MSQETLEWLNQNTLIGFTSRRGHAWHYRKSAQGETPNHYEEAIPVDDVLRRLFNWQAIELPMSIEIPADAESMTKLDERGNPVRQITMEGRKAVVSSDTFEVLGVFKDGYIPHQYDKWLVNQVATILDDELSISSAGLLKNRAVAWIEVSVPDTITTPEGVSFRPNLLACTSFDGSLATTYKRTVQLTVCDNTMSAALGEQGQQLKIRHSKNSHVKLADAREALEIVYDTADEFAREVDRLTSWSITESQWERVLETMVPTKDSERSITSAYEKRAQIDSLYQHDQRVTPWKGSAFGALQAFNTWTHHLRPTRGETIRAERNMLNAINGKTDKRDAEVLAVLASV